MLRAASIGTGWWGTELAAAVQGKSREIGIVACASLDAQSRAEFADRFNVRAAESFEQILADPEIEAVLLATPHSLHAKHAIAAASAGKHVYVEKPFTLTVDQGRQTIAACRAAGRVLAVGHNRRLLAGLALLKQLIDGGRLGTVLHVEANFSTAEGLAFAPGAWRLSRTESPGGAMFTLGVHVVDWLHHLFGPVARVTAQFRRRVMAHDIDDTASALLEFESGVTGYLGAMYAAPYTNYVHIFGSRANAVFRASQPESPNVRPSLFVQRADGGRELIDVPWVDTLHLQLERFAGACRGKGKVAVTGEEALANVAAMAAIIASAADGQAKAPEYAER
ncbi:MAG: Gfo/Idh/MocA family oxidoreductase [Proteobacteria bacterium]|nr:Gfo/Idh/MocA family oxidoreductase [Pseudomonadota bacterium]